MPSFYPENNTPVETDNERRVLQKILGTLRTSTASGDAYSAYHSTAYENAEVVKASAGTLYKLVIYNSGPAQWIQVHNTTSIPADTAVPKMIYKIASDASLVIDLTNKGANFDTGITICNSTTGPTKTIGAADCWFTVLYA